MAISDIADILEITEDEANQAVSDLSQALQGRGVRLVSQGAFVELATVPDAHDVIRTLAKRELTKKLGRAGIETLTIILYHAPVTRRDIDFIRGVNSSSTIRNLLIRGLVAKQEKADSTKQVAYEPTTKLLRYLGIQNVSELPEFERYHQEVNRFYQETDTAETQPNN